jgi:O-Antigen ligase
MEHQNLAEASAALGAFAGPLFLLARGRSALLVGIAGVLVAEAGLAYALVPDAPSRLTESTLHIGLVVAMASGTAALAAVLVRFPAAIPVLLLVAAPFRLTVGLGSESASLLLPTYFVLIGAAAALAYRTLRRGSVQPVSLLIALPASAIVGLAAISLLWARDPRSGVIELLFFYLPFATLLAIVARTPLARWTGRALVTGLLSLTALFAAVGLYEAWTHTLFIGNPGVRYANAFSSYFRVTSLFQDPSVYARHLVLGMLVLLVLLWAERLGLLVGLGLMGLLGAGLYFSYSQTSFAALFVGVLAIGLIAGDAHTRRLLAVVASALAVAGGVVALAALDGQSARRFTRDRLPLVKITAPVYQDHPVIGVGIGSQPLVSGENTPGRRRKDNVSHTTPLTIAAELGTIGLLAYVAFVLGIGRALLLAWRRDRALGLVLIACATALIAHSLSYGSFFEDPLLWGLVGLCAAVLAFAPHAAIESPQRARRDIRTRAKPVPTPPPGSAAR